MVSIACIAGHFSIIATFGGDHYRHVPLYNYTDTVLQLKVRCYVLWGEAVIKCGWNLKVSIPCLSPIKSVCQIFLLGEYLVVSYPNCYSISFCFGIWHTTCIYFYSLILMMAISMLLLVWLINEA